MNRWALFRGLARQECSSPGRLRQIAAAPGCLSAMVIVAVGGSGGHHSQGVQSGVLDEDRHEFSARVRGETSETGQR